MSRPTLTIALVSDVFHATDGAERLHARLEEAKAAGAELAVLPELPLNPWSPATKQATDKDAEPPEGPRWQVQSRAAATVGIGLVGGAIVRDSATGRRHNTALVFRSDGVLAATFSKLHLPEEPGFWETSHYEPGEHHCPVIDGFGVPIGVQICSDINRPEGCHALAASGAKLIVAPRATEQATYDRWRVVFRANALTSCAYIASVNRPRPEQDVGIGGPSIVVDPTGAVVLETTDAVSVATIDSRMVDAAGIAYPGYLPVRGDVYARAWEAAASSADFR